MAIAAAGLNMVKCDVEWDVRAQFPALHAAIKRGDTEKWLGDALGALSTSGVPAPPTCQSFAAGSFFRLPKHRRCFYYSPNPTYGSAPPAGNSTKGCIAIKGAEPLTSDFESLLAALQGRLTPPVMSMFMTQRRHAEYISVIETKVPGVLCLDEAFEEAAIAGEVQTRHLEAYGTLAKLPLPLLVQRLPADTHKAAVEKVARSVSQRGWERIRRRFAEGIGVYAYYYPSVPLRSDALKGLLKLPANSREHLNGMLREVKVDALIGSWTDLFVRLLYLGYLHCSLGSFQSGMMLQEQNIVVDGGYVDVDSIIPMKKLPNDVLFHETLQLSMFVLCRSVRLLLVNHVLWHLQKGLTDYVEKMIHDHMVGRIRRAIETEARPGLTMDPRVLDHFNGTPSFEALIAGLEAFYPPPDMLDADERLDAEKIPRAF